MAKKILLPIDGSDASMGVLRSLCDTLKLPFHSATVENKSVVKGIFEAQQSLGCDLIAMGSHGRGGVSALVLGSVAQKVLAQSPVPVMLLKA